MANISYVKTPDNTIYTVHDPLARPLNNNDFDTINVTELNAGDLIATGVGRFTNGLYGNLIGNADTATSAIKATQDESGNNIKATYANSISISDHTITLSNKNGTSLGTVTVPDNNTTYEVATGTADGKIKVTPSSGSAYEVSVYGLKSAAYKDVTDSYSESGTDPVSGKAVKQAIDGLPSPMVFRGTVGTGGTVTSLPVDGSATVGDTYKVITDGTYGGKASKIGDTLICLTKTPSANTWEIVPSGDEPSGTVTSVAVSNGGGLSVSGSPITSSGTITISHADTSSQASVDNSGRTYIQDISLDTYGHVTKITSATETVVNTDRYVNSAAFADATSADTNNPVKMTLTRAGSDTASVTAYIPKVSSSSAGVAPKGASVSTQSQSTKFLREDGTWAAPSYTTDTNTHRPIQMNGTEILGNNTNPLNLKAGTNVSLSNSSGTVTITATDTNTTYSLSADTTNNKITLTPSSGSAQSITVPYATSAGSATDNTKLPLAGGTMTGQIVLASNGYRTNNAAGYSVDQHGNFTHLGTTTSDYWHLNSNNGTSKFSVYWETGNVTAAGTITASKFVGVSEADLQWGGKNFTAGYGCIDAALMDELGANRFQFIKASAITVEYSRDGGSTWTDYGATDAQKQQIFAQGGSLTIGKADSANRATEHPGQYQLRITIDTGVASVYTVLNKFIVYVSTSGSANCACKIQKALQSTPTTFVDHTDWISISGWSGYNVLNTNSLTTYGNSPSGQYGRVRFIFKDGEGGNTNYYGLVISQIKGFGGVGWNTPSTMAKSRHLYTYDENQNATFPSELKMPYATIWVQGGSAAGGNSNRMTLTNGMPTGLSYNTSQRGTRIYANAIAFADPYNGNSNNDAGWIRHIEETANTGTLELATGDDGNESIVARQYNTSSAIVREVVILNSSGNSSFPGNVTASKFIGALQGNADTATSATSATSATTASKLGSSNVGSATQPIYLASGTATACTYTLGKSVPSDAVFTDTNDKVKQSPSTTDANYELLLSGSADNTEHTETAKKTSSLYFNPNKSALTVGTRASGTVGAYSFTAGQDNVASHSQSIAVGYGNTASADQAFACGNGNTAAGNYSHVEGKGCSTTDNAWYQHAEGQGCTAGGDAGHAEGCATVTSAAYAHAEGLGTYAGSQAQHVFGKYNTKDTSGTYVEIVGNGSADDARSYARRLSWTGNEELAGSLTVGGSVNFASSTWNNIGDDIKFGDIDYAGTVAFKGISGDTTVRLNEKDNDKKYIYLKLNSSEAKAYIQTSQALRIKSEGAIEFFTNSNVTSYNYAGNGYVPMRASAFTVMSSKLVKSNIKDITKEKAEKILELRPVTFDMWHGENNQSGMIAEEVLEVLPELVIVPENYDEEEAKAKIENDELVDVPSLDYTKFVPYLIRIVQEQQKEIDELKSVIND